MDAQKVAVYAIPAVGVLAAVLYLSRRTTTSYATDPGAVANASAIEAANTAALTLGANERTSALTLAEDYAKNHDNNQTAITQEWLRGTSALDLTQMATEATIASKSMDDTTALQTARVSGTTAENIAAITAKQAIVTTKLTTDASVAATQSQANAAIQVAAAQKPSFLQQLTAFAQQVSSFFTGVPVPGPATATTQLAPSSAGLPVGQHS